MKTIVHVVAASLLAAVCGCADGGTEGTLSEAEAETARAEIAQTIRAWEQVWKSGDAEAAAAGFTVNAINMRPGAASDSGRAVFASMAADFLSSVTINDVTLTTEELDVYGDVAYERGTFVQRYAADGDEVTQRSRYMAVWRRGDDGTWRYHRFLFNNVPSD